MSTTVKLYDYSFSSVKTYLFAAIFVAGNLVLPQLVHFVPNGGPTFLPIYFFTLIAAYKYGLKAGLLTAVLSPVINSLLFGMPPLAVLPAILVKSGLLAVAASLVAKRTRKISVLNLLVVVLAYQVIGTGFEWAMSQNFHTAMQDFRIGVPGMILQVFGGYLVLKVLARV